MMMLLSAIQNRFEHTAKTVVVFVPLLFFGSESLADLAYISNEKDNTISVIDLDSLEVVNTLEVGIRPRGIIFSNNYKYLYICASESDTVQVMDVSSHKIVHELPSGDDPEQFYLHPDNKRLFISNEDDAVVTVVDTDSRQVIAQIDVGIEPEGMSVSPDGRWAVNTSETTNMVHWIDTTTYEVVDNTLVGQRPRHVEFNKEGSILWASSEIGGTVTIMNVANRKTIKTLEFEIPGMHSDKIQPVGIKLTDDGKWAFIALGPASHVAVVNAQTYEIENYILVGRRVWHMALSQDQSKLLTTNGISGDVSVIDVDSLKAVKSIKVGRLPWGIAIKPNGPQS